MASKTAVNGEVSAVGGDDLRVAMDFGHDDERGVRRVHAVVFHHELLGSLQVSGPWMQQLDCARPDQAQKRVDGLRVAAQMPTRLPEHDLGGVKRTPNLGQGFDRP